MGNVALKSFASGELAPAMYARTDTAKYTAGARTIRNLLPLRQGGVTSRPGLEYGATAAGSTGRGIPFVYNDAQSYSLIFTDLLITVMQDNAVVMNGASPVTVVTPYLAADIPDLIVVQSADVMTIVHPSYAPRDLARVSQTDWTLTTTAFGPSQPAIPTGPFISPSGASYLNVATATNASPINVGLLFPAAPADGSTVTITGATGNTAANGTWVITRLASSDPNYRTNFTLNNSTGNGAYNANSAKVYFGAIVTIYYAVSAVGPNGAESAITLSGATTWVTGDPTPRVITWGAATGAVSYNVYKGYDNETLGLIGSAFGTTFTDSTTSANAAGLTPDFSTTAPITPTVFASTDNYPAAVGYFQDRRFYAGTNDNPEEILASVTGDYTNFSYHSPLQDDDSVDATLVSRKVNLIRHIVDAGMLIVLTSGGEWVINGDPAGIVRPTEVNAKNFTKHGSSTLPPIEIDQRLLYVQARNAKVRDVGVDPSVQWYGFRGRDLTMYANHLFDGHTLIAWCYAEEPHSVIWAVRDDGILLSLTLVDEENVMAWAHHDTDGTVLSVWAVPEGTEDRVYVLVQRANGTYVERMRSLFWTALPNDPDVDITTNAAFLDSMQFYDGRNVGSTTLTLSGGLSYTLTGGTLWTPAETLTLTASGNVFSAGDVGATFPVTNDAGEAFSLVIGTYVSPTVVTGNVTAEVPVDMRAVSIPDWQFNQPLTLTASASQFVLGDVGNRYDLTGADGSVVRCTVSAYTSATHVTIFPDAHVPASLRSTATLVWTRAVVSVSGLDHLDGQQVSVFADGYVVGSPNNPTISTVYTVSAGAITLDQPYGVIYVGLPYTQDLETLDIDTAEGPSLKTSRMNVERITLELLNTRGLWCGPGDPEPPDHSVGTAAGTNLQQTKLTSIPTDNAPVPVANGDYDVNVKGGWTTNGRVFIRQVDPLPMTINAVIPVGFFPPAGGGR